MNQDLSPNVILIEKDIEHRIITGNNNLLKYIGKLSVDALCGLTDDNLCWCEYTPIYLQHERDVLKGKNYSLICPSKDSRDQFHVFLVTKTAKKDSRGNIIGIFCHCTEILNPHWHILAIALAKNAPPEQSCYSIGKPNPFNLSPREAEILFYLTRGKSTKVIASILYRSKRTIECHIEHIKNKLKCHTRAELVAFAIMQGFATMLPKQDAATTMVEKLDA